MRDINSKKERLLTFEPSDIFRNGNKIFGSFDIKVTLLSIYEKSEDENDFEYNYALQDSIDEILDLKINETIYFQYDRNDQNSKGLLTRIN